MEEDSWTATPAADLEASLKPKRSSPPLAADEKTQDPEGLGEKEEERPDEGEPRQQPAPPPPPAADRDSSISSHETDEPEETEDAWRSTLSWFASDKPIHWDGPLKPGDPPECRRSPAGCRVLGAGLKEEGTGLDALGNLEEVAYPDYKVDSKPTRVKSVAEAADRDSRPSPAP